MKILETEYKGYKFRSRLEARLAVFFDACKVNWEYEPECYDLGNGNYYLPDFLLHDVILQRLGRAGKVRTKIDLYAEVKRKATESDKEIIKLFTSDNNSKSGEIVNPTIILPIISYVNDIWDIFNDIDKSFSYYCLFPFNFASIDGDNFEAFPGMNKDGQFSIFGQYDLYDLDYKSTDKAYKLAKQARFENF